MKLIAIIEKCNDHSNSLDSFLSRMNKESHLSHLLGAELCSFTFDQSHQLCDRDHDIQISIHFRV